MTNNISIKLIKYDKQDQQGKAAFNERNPHITQQQEPVARSPGGPQTKTGQGKNMKNKINKERRRSMNAAATL
jgi:hypothetical protein